MFEIGFFVIVVFCFGAAIGSFLHVVAERYGTGESIVGRSVKSYCPHCKKTLHWLEMIPLVSYVLSRARCKGCRAPIPAHYPTVELLAGLVAVLLIVPSILQYSGLVGALLLYTAACILMVIIRIDSRLMLIPDGYVYILVLIAVLYAWRTYGDVNDIALGVVTGVGALYALWAGTAGRGIGFGDVKLMIPLGILFGLRGVIALLFFAFFAGGAVSVLLLVTGKVTPKTAIPFGPFLAGAAIAIMVFPGIIDRFFAILGVY